jgi:hypothetical protein
MGDVPLLLPTLVVLAVVWIEWRHTRAIACVALVAAFVLLIAVMRHPAFSAEEILAYGDSLFGAPVAFARVLGAGCFLYSVVRLIRTNGIPW